jgi:hypothetical protein
MDAWLQFASGAVEWNATVPLGGGATIDFLDLMFAAEAAILTATPEVFAHGRCGVDPDIGVNEERP